MNHYLFSSEYNDNSLSNNTTMLIIMLFVTVFLIYKTYQTSVTNKTFIINIYLYVLVALLFVAIMGKRAESSNITNPNNVWNMAILYIILGFGGIFMMTKDKFFVNHIGFLLLLLALSLTTGLSYRNSINVVRTATITAIIMAVLTIGVFATSEESLIKIVIIISLDS